MNTLNNEDTVTIEVINLEEVSKKNKKMKLKRNLKSLAVGVAIGVAGVLYYEGVIYVTKSIFNIED